MSFLHATAIRAVRTAAQTAIAAIDAGGLPLNAAIVNDIARALGLDVSSRANLQDTIARIRAAVQRLPP
jgi:hypothetical protein